MLAMSAPMPRRNNANTPQRVFDGRNTYNYGCSGISDEVSTSSRKERRKGAPESHLGKNIAH